jgi:hypothetical protein
VIPLDSLSPKRRVAHVLAILLAVTAAYALLIGGLLSASTRIAAIALALLLAGFVLPFALKSRAQLHPTARKRRSYFVWLLVICAALGPVLAASGPSALCLVGGLLAGYLSSIVVQEALRLTRNQERST